MLNKTETCLPTGRHQNKKDIISLVIDGNNDF
jgi:hypothetical protein